MQMEVLQIVQKSPGEVEERIYQRLKNELETLKKEFQPREPTEFLTRNEVRDLLKVDLSTIWAWTKKGRLKAYGIAGMVYYKRSEVEAAIEPLNA